MAIARLDSKTLAAIGVGIIFAAALQGIARNPAKEGSIKGFALLGMALASPQMKPQTKLQAKPVPQ